ERQQRTRRVVVRRRRCRRGRRRSRLRAAQAEGLTRMIPERRQWLVVAAAGVAFGTVAGIAVAGSLALPAPSSSVRAIGLCVGSTVLGLAVLAVMVQRQRRPAVSSETLWRTIAALGGVWLALASVDLAWAASTAADVPA